MLAFLLFIFRFNILLVLLSLLMFFPLDIVQYHPDVNKEPGATEKFKEISTAYEVSVL